VEGDALVDHEAEGVVDPLRGDGRAIDDPRLIDLVLGEAVPRQEARPEVAVDHAMLVSPASGTTGGGRRCPRRPG
jgi:hypothetical protein